MKYLRNIEPIHQEALNVIIETLTTEHGISMRDLHYRLGENQTFESWLRAMLFKDVWDFTQYVEICDLTRDARKEMRTIFQAMKDRLNSVWSETEAEETKELELQLIQLKKAYLNLLMEVEGYKFAERMYREDPDAPTLWIHPGTTAIGQQDYFLSYGDMMHFFTNMVFADTGNDLYNATLDLYFTVCFDYANVTQIEDEDIPEVIDGSRSGMVDLGREILEYMTHLNRRLS